MPAVELTIAGLGFRMEASREIPQHRGFLPFSGSIPSRDWHIRFLEADKIPPGSGCEVFREETFGVKRDGEEDTRLFYGVLYGDAPYAASKCDPSRRTVEVTCARDSGQYFRDISRYFSHIGFEQLLMEDGRLALHASLVDSPFGGILFSGPSGIGKSTQAELWHTFDGSQIINGDRPILYRGEKGWLACGSPYAGSSGYFINKHVPIAAIVMLEQGKRNALRPLRVPDAFRKLYAQTIINTWNPEYVSRACGLLTDLAASIPVYHLVCTPDQTAVETVKRELQRRYAGESSEISPDFRKDGEELL